MRDFTLLTIGIPTFNRAPYIKELINSILIQVDSTISHKLEVLISDNASTDNTEEVLREYQEKYPQIFSYFKNEENVGFDKNVDLIFKRAKGKYVWLLSDDDTLENNSLSYLIDKINCCRQCSVILVNYCECSIEMNKYLKRIRQDIKEDVYCKDGNVFFQESKFLFGLVSSLIIKTQEWHSANITKYLGSNWIHVGAIIEILQQKPACIIAKHIVNLRTGNSEWGKQGSFLSYGFSLLDIFLNMKDLGYKKETYNQLIFNMYKGNFKAIISANSQGLRNKKDIAKRMIKYYYPYPSLWFIHLPILFVPNFLWFILKNTKAAVYKILKLTRP